MLIKGWLHFESSFWIRSLSVWSSVCLPSPSSLCLLLPVLEIGPTGSPSSAYILSTVVDTFEQTTKDSVRTATCSVLVGISFKPPASFSCWIYTCYPNRTFDTAVVPVACRHISFPLLKSFLASRGIVVISMRCWVITFHGVDGLLKRSKGSLFSVPAIVGSFD